MSRFFLHLCFGAVILSESSGRLPSASPAPFVGDCPEQRCFLDSLKAGAAACGLSDCRVLCAVSGGADSVALTAGLCRLSDELRIEVVIAHLNHHLRGAESDADAEWVEAFGRQLGVPVVVRSLDVAGRAASHSETIEEAARHLRYSALIEIAIEHRCRAVATGHNADDLVETVLHHIVRGTGLTGLRGMPQTRLLTRGTDETSQEIQLVRPLLRVTRQEIAQWLTSAGFAHRTDATNADSAFTRNRIRNELLPLLERDFNPQVRKSLLSLATQASEVSDWLSEVATRLANAVRLDAQSTVLRIDADLLRAEPVCLVREALRILWQANDWPQQSMTFRHWQQLAELVPQSSGSLNLPGNVIARRRQKLLVLERH